MKRTFLILLLVATAFAGKSQEKPIPYPAAETMIKRFYTSYITSVALDPPKVMETRLKGLIKQYCTQKLARKLPETGAQSGADPVIRAQDSDTSVLKTLSIKKNLKKQGDYTLSYSFEDPGATPRSIKIMIYLTVVKLNGAYKIDDIR